MKEVKRIGDIPIMVDDHGVFHADVNGQHYAYASFGRIERMVSGEKEVVHGLFVPRYLNQPPRKIVRHLAYGKSFRDDQGEIVRPDADTRKPQSIFLAHDQEDREYLDAAEAQLRQITAEYAALATRYRGVIAGLRQRWTNDGIGYYGSSLSWSTPS